MTLSEILIASGVTPNMLAVDCKFITQDGDDGMINEHAYNPTKTGDVWWNDFLTRESFTDDELFLDVSKDWQTPLSREQFTADYAAHQADKQ